jgi:predicted TIM-barrel fold metal-dependent hydrolase
MPGRKGASAAAIRAKAVNDLVAETDRFAGFAALPRQDPQAAAKELERVCDRLWRMPGMR